MPWDGFESFSDEKKTRSGTKFIIATCKNELKAICFDCDRKFSVVHKVMAETRSKNGIKKENFCLCPHCFVETYGL